MAVSRVLIVDDEEAFSSVLAERMKTRGIEADTVASGAEALERVKHKSYDAVVLDLAMPKLDGMETLKKLLEDNPDLQVIVLTGHATLEKGIEAVKRGAAEFLEKPAKIGTLVEKIEEAQAKKTLLFEKKMEDAVSDIVRKKGW
jgi:DNA-binding NtrC family response regulator